MLIDARIQSHARLFVGIYIRACDKTHILFQVRTYVTGVQIATPLDYYSLQNRLCFFVWFFFRFSGELRQAGRGKRE